MIEKRQISDVLVKDKRVLIRLDLNCPLKEGKVSDDFRILESLPTIRMVTERGGKAILMSHLGRPKGKVNPEFSLKPVRDCLEARLGKPVQILEQVVGDEVKAALKKMEPGGVLLLENLRYVAGEEKDDLDFAKALAELGDLYVNDAFGCSHRKHSSVSAITTLLPTYCGPLMAKELHYLSGLESAPKPFVAILGGAKTDTKLPIIRSLVDKVDKILLGGAMSYTFLLAQGKEVGKSMTDPDYVQECKEILDAHGDKIQLPLDHMVAREFKDEAPIQMVEEIPKDAIAVDIGLETVREYARVIYEAKTVIWNGPQGAFEIPAFGWGTHSLALRIASVPKEITTIAGGGDIVAALRRFGLLEHLTFVSTGGGAFIEFICGDKLPGVECLPNKE